MKRHNAKSILLDNQAYSKIKTLSLVTLLLLSGLLMISLGPLSPVSADTSAYSYYKEITIESDYIDTALTNFPILIYRASDSDLANDAKCQNDGDDIAFYTSDGNTQYHHEIEKFNGATGELWVWVNITSISSTSDTTIRMYYGDDDGSNQEDVSGTWDQYYVGVWHIDAASGNQADSTSNGLTATASGNPTYQQAGKVGYAIDFDGDGDYFTVATDPALDALTSFAVTTISYCEDMNDDCTIWSFNNGATDKMNLRYEDTSSSPAYGIRLFNDIANEGAGAIFLGTNTKTDLEDYWHTFHITNSNDGLYSAYNATTNVLDEENLVQSLSNLTNGYVFTIGEELDKNYDEFEGYIDEVRIHSIERNTSYINATFHAINQTTGFITIDSEQENSEKTFTLTGLDSNDRIVFSSGEAGDTVWANTTTLLITTSMNVGYNCTDIYIDFNSTNLGSIPIANNLKMEVNTENSSGWTGNTYTITSNDANISLNTADSGWGAGSPEWRHGDNPFNITNGDGSTTLYIRFKLSIPLGTSADTYTCDGWKVTWKYEG